MRFRHGALHDPLGCPPIRLLTTHGVRTEFVVALAGVVDLEVAGAELPANLAVTDDRLEAEGGIHMLTQAAAADSDPPSGGGGGRRERSG